MCLRGGGRNRGSSAVSTQTHGLALLTDTEHQGRQVGQSAARECQQQSCSVPQVSSATRARVKRLEHV